MSRKRRGILIALSQQDGRERATLAGLYMRVLRRPEWAAYIIDPGRLTYESIRAMTLDAVVGRVSPDIANRFGPEMAIVSTAHGRFEHAVSILSDDAAIGHAAANYFLDRGFKNFAYIGSSRAPSQTCAEAFAARLANLGATVQTYRGPDTGAAPWSPMAVDRELTAWVRELPALTAVLAESDLVGFRVSEICRHYHIPIPDHLSLVGVGNDDLMCRLCNPTLTTIATPTEQIGVTIAELLDQLFAGRTPAVRTITLPHSGIIERQSANIIRTDDAEVAIALRYIRSNAQKQIAIEDIVAVVLTSRRTLERRFRRVMGMSLQAAITRTRVERAKGLLAYSRSPIQDVAHLSGFTTAQRFHIMFRRATGTTPQAYRQQFQAAGLEKAPSRA